MLYLVATPIGNLGDISLRALEVLKSVDAIAAEDTRTTGVLLRHYGISKPQIPYHEHNEAQAANRIFGMLNMGQSVAVVSDAGTPAISDPGFTLVRRAIAEGIEVTMIPGASAVLMALVLSGLPAHSFTFRGFPPRKSGQRRRFLEIDAASPHTLIFYESPFRLAAFLEDALAVLGDRRAAICNDLTKLYEKVERAPLSELIPLLREPAKDGKPGKEKSLKGEWVVVIEGFDAKAAAASVDSDEAD